MNISKKIEHCYGCGACENVCPVDAIKMIEDKYGFLRVSIVEDKCINCSKCETVCPSLNNKYDNDENPLCYATWAEDNIREKCASGGIFSALAMDIIERGGWIAGAVWTDDFRSEFILTNSMDGLKKISNSKYIQANTKDVYKQIKTRLDNNDEVLFCGCPCQVAGLKNFLYKEYEKLYTMDLICHGVPSQTILKKYLVDTYDYDNIEKVDFRDKTYFGWSTEMNVYLKDKNIQRKRATEDSYYKAFLNNMSLNPTCEFCQFSRIPRQGDLSLGDFWQIERYDATLNDGKGTSLVLVNSKKGNSLFNSSSKIIKKEEVPFSFISQTCNSTVFKPFKHHFGRNRFLQEFTKQDFTKAVNQSLDAHYDIGLMTTWFARNYGAIFTAYALYAKLEELGYTVLMLHKPLELWDRDYFSTEKNTIAIDFGKKHYNVSKEYSIYEGDRHLALLNNHCDIFMTGSDQLWNPKIYAKRFYYFMDFVDDKRKKIAYATSIGASKFEGEESEKPKISYLLSRFDDISVREQEAVEVCVKEYDVEATQVIDPVFLLDKSYYEEMVNRVEVSKGEKKEYIFAYILDGNLEKKKIIDKIVEKYNLPIVCSYDIEWPQISRDILNYPDAQISTPEEWLWYIKNAKLILTDSFHGACFSIIFNKEFLCFGNKLRGINRFKELFSMLGIQKRLITQDDNQERIILKFLDKKINYKRVNYYIEKERERSQKWLLHALAKKKEEKITHEDYLFSKTENRINKVVAAIDEKNKVETISSIYQIGLKDGCSIQDIIFKMRPNSYLQQVQGRMGEPVSDTPVGFGVLTIKKTSNYFVEVTFSEMAGKNKTPRLWIANVTEQKVLRWNRMVGIDELGVMENNVKENAEAIQLVNQKNMLKVYSNISQLGLSSGVSIEEIIKRMEENSYLQQVQGKMNEPISDTPAPFGVLTIKKTTNYFVEVMFSESASNAVIWIAKVLDGKVFKWRKMISEEETKVTENKLYQEIESTKERLEILERCIDKLVNKE